MLAAHEASGRASAADSASASVELGRVGRPHKLSGALSVQLYGDDPTNLLNADEVTLTGEVGSIPFHVRRAEDAGSGPGGAGQVRLWLDGIEDREAAEAWTGAVVSVAESALAPLPEGEFYWRELIGTRCRLPDGELLGTVAELWPTRGHDVVVVKSAGRTVLLPATDDVLVRLDRERGELWVDPPPGLLDGEED